MTRFVLCKNGSLSSVGSSSKPTLVLTIFKWFWTLSQIVTYTNSCRLIRRTSSTMVQNFRPLFRWSTSVPSRDVYLPQCPLRVFTFSHVLKPPDHVDRHPSPSSPLLRPLILSLVYHLSENRGDSYVTRHDFEISFEQVGRRTSDVHRVLPKLTPGCI